jgi:hypothetical protein
MQVAANAYKISDSDSEMACEYRTASFMESSVINLLVTLHVWKRLKGSESKIICRASAAYKHEQLTI